MLLVVVQIRSVNFVDVCGLTALGLGLARITLFFTQTAPHAVDLACPQRERQAFTLDRASGTDGLRLRHLHPGADDEIGKNRSGSANWQAAKERQCFPGTRSPVPRQLVHDIPPAWATR